MIDDLDQLLELTRNVESAPIARPVLEAETDIDAIYVDYGDSATPFGAKPTITKIGGASQPEAQQPTENAPGECSGNVTAPDAERGPLFEEPENDTETAEQVTDGIKQAAEGIRDMVGEGLGLGDISLNECIERGMGREFMRMYLLESSGQCCQQQEGFHLGDVVHCGNIPALFVVKKADGQMVTAAKPTSNPNELLTSCDGEWPTFTFRATEIQPMLDASIDDVQSISTFNDRSIPFDGSTIDDGPMKCAQSDAKCNMMDRIADNLDEILGMPYKDICAGKDPKCTVINQPTETVVINPDGSFGTLPREGGYKVKIGD
jgi:hypothetical protein